MTAIVRVYTPKPELTLSAAPGVQHDYTEDVADPELERLRWGYAMRAALGHTHDGPCIPVELERDEPIITESELRLLDGNR